MTHPADAPVPGERVTSLHIEQAIRNDRPSTGWLVARFTPLLLCQARHRIPPSLQKFCDADDVVADVWMAVLPQLPKLEPSGGSLSRGLVSFASTVLMRRVRDLLEKHVLGKPAAGPLGEGGNPPDLVADMRGVVSHVVTEEHRGAVWKTLETLPPEDREILVLRGIEGLSHKEVADRVGITPENSAVRYHRLLKQLRDRLPGSVLEDLEE
jgi:RNA polymerase sigma-70 factor, ECF subfamily